MKCKLVNNKITSNYVDSLLLERGVSFENLELLKNPTEQCLCDYNTLDNIQSAAAYILNAVKSKKKFCLIADCDVDGLTSSTIIYHYLHELDPEVSIQYLFHEHKQHGLEDCCEYIMDNMDINVVLEPDAGINDRIYHDSLGQQGITTIVMDHHEWNGEEFSKFAICVDNQIGEYANKSLAGCGVTWQVCRMIDELNGSTYAFKYIDLVALGCAADVMSPLTLENRYIFDYGFSHIQDKMFKALIDKQSFSMKGVVDYTSVAFYIAPLINACMRTGEKEEKALMYRSFFEPDTEVESHKRGVAKGTMVNIGEECGRILTNVKARQQRLIDKYEAIFEDRIQSEGLNDNNVLFIHLQDCDKFDSELNGLLAMRFSGNYHKPCIVARDGLDNLTKGSVRNPNGSPVSNLKSFMTESSYVDFAAGHEGAYGIGIQTEHVEDFIDWFNRETSDLNWNENCYEVNFELNNYDTYLESLCYDIAENNKLWGGNNPQPIIYIKNIRLTSDQIIVMGKGDTMKFIVNGVPCIMFHCTNIINSLKNNNTPLIIDLIGRPQLNEWMGKTNVQLIIDELDWHNETNLDF